MPSYVPEQDAATDKQSKWEQFSPHPNTTMRARSDTVIQTAEEAVLRLLPTHAPTYYVVANPLHHKRRRVYDFLCGSSMNGLHSALDPCVGGGITGTRGERKCVQIKNMVSAIAMISRTVCRKHRNTQRTMVDFCGGLGHLGLVLASLYPSWQVVVVDVKKDALRVVKRRAKEAELTNVRTWRGKVDSYDGILDIGIALHACGSSSNDVLNICVQRGAMMVIAPCYVGGVLSPKEYAKSWTKGEDCTVAQSVHFQSVLNPWEYDALACAAAYAKSRKSEEDSLRKASKALIENDRIERLKELGYDAKLMKMYPTNCTRKNDMIIGWPRGKVSFDAKLKIDERMMRFFEMILYH